MKTVIDLIKLKRIQSILEDIHRKSMPMGFDFGNSEVDILAEEGIKIINELLDGE